MLPFPTLSAARALPADRPRALLAGGAGYIGAHVCAVLLAEGWDVVLLDDFSNAPRDALARIEAIGLGRPRLWRGDLRDGALLDRLFAVERPDAVVHLAGLKAVGESVADPLRYYDVNLGGAVSLLAAMRRHGVGRLAFSSSATVYAAPGPRIAEDAPLGALNPYGRSKLMIERVVDDLCAAAPDFAAVSLRYFNPVGAHPSGLIGEVPNGTPNNLFPYIARVAAGLSDRLRVFGADWPTPDGSGVRDYIHVMDLAEGHLAALRLLMGPQAQRGRHLAVNLGTGRGYSVFEAAAAFGAAAGVDIPLAVTARRPGDAAECTADPSRAAELLGWRATRGLAQMCADHWAFQRGLARREAA
jgi:UDP-glucose 4-epimerase